MNNIKQEILYKDLNGFPLSSKIEGFEIISEIIEEAQKIIAELNTGYHTKEEVREIFSRLTGKDIDASTWILPPFYTDFGKNIKLGKNVFINHCCEFMDRGGITIEDNCFIGPKVNLITINHDLRPDKRHITTNKKIHIKKNVWIGVGATVMPGVTVNENAIISAGAVVTKDVEANTIVAGVPAKVIKIVPEG